jgi:hypothetical protein
MKLRMSTTAESDNILLLNSKNGSDSSHGESTSSDGVPDATATGAIRDARDSSPAHTASREVNRTFDSNFVRNWNDMSEERFVLELLVIMQLVDKKKQIDPLIEVHRT